MRRRGGSQVYSKRDTWRNLRRPCRPQIFSKQSYLNRLFLAYYAGRCKGTRQEVRQVPEVWERPISPNRETNNDSLPLAVLHKVALATRNLTPHGKDHIGSSITSVKVVITWRPWKDRGSYDHGTLSTWRSTTNRCNRWLYSFLKVIKELFSQFRNANEPNNLKVTKND